MKKILTIAGSDSSGGAGIQGDLRTITSLGHHCLTAITSITSQNTVAVTDIQKVKVEPQLKALVEDISLDGIKIGMIHSKENLQAIIDFLSKMKDLPIVLDPVILSTTGTRLIDEECLELMKKELIKKVSLMTPNLDEVLYLLNYGTKENKYGIKDDNKDDKSLEIMKDLAKAFYREYGVPILLKGGHSKGINAIDILYDGDKIHCFEVKRLANQHTHGTGCCLSSAICCYLATGMTMEAAIREAKQVITEAINHGYPLGKGPGPVDPILYKIKVCDKGEVLDE